MAMTRSTRRTSNDDGQNMKCSGAPVTTYGNADDDDATLSFPNASGDNKRWTLRRKDTEQDLWYCRGNYKDTIAERYKDRIQVSSCDDIAKGNAKVTILKLSPSDGGLYALCNDEELCTCSNLVITAAKTEPPNTAHEAEKSSNKSKAKSPEGTDTTPSLENDNKDGNTGRIVGGVGGGVVVVAVLIFVGCGLHKRRRRRA